MIPLRNEKNKLVQDTRESVLKLLSEDQTDRLAAGVPGVRPPPPSTTPGMYQNAGKPQNKSDGKKLAPGPGSDGEAPPAPPEGGATTPGTVE